MVYPHWLARLLHNAPLPLLGLLAFSGAGGVTLGALSGGLVLGLLSILLGLLFPAAVGALRANYYSECLLCCTTGAALGPLGLPAGIGRCPDSQ